MAERPEFVGEPMAVSKAELVQDSPWVVTRRVSDDVSIIKPAQPQSSEIRFDLAGHRDYRGLRTIEDMSGEVHARFVLSNVLDEPVFALFKCPHPRAQSGGSANLLASGLRFQASAGGVQEAAQDAWFWSGTLAPHAAATMDVSYQAASLRSVAYHAGDQNGNPINHLLVTVHRENLDPLRCESGDGIKPPAAETVWERREFLAPDSFSAAIVESRSLYSSLSQLLEIGPLVCLLFLLAVSAAVLARQALTPVQMLTIAAVYALYFPLILYLSTRFTFVIALGIAAVVPGALLVNYARWLLGSRLGWLGAPPLLALYWVFPTLAAFAGWNRGMVLLCLGVVTLWVLIDLQNRALRRTAAAAALLLALAFSARAGAAEVQVILPAELSGRPPEAKTEAPAPIIGFQPAAYQAREEENSFRVEAQAGFRVLGSGQVTAALFETPVHLIEARVESAQTNPAVILTISNRLQLFVQSAGSGTVRLEYRVPIEMREGKRRAQIPLLAGFPGGVHLEAVRSDFEVVTGALWAKSSAEQHTVCDIGVAGEPLLVLEWRPAILPPEAGTNLPAPPTPTGQFYGIGLSRAQNLTLVNSDGSCTHFADFEVPAVPREKFRMRLAPEARLISVSIDGNEVSPPAIQDQLCDLQLPPHESQQAVHRLSFRIALPRLALGFRGTADLVLPEVFQTAGLIEWVLALPAGFETQVFASGLEVQKTSPDLERFGDYGRLLKSRTVIFLAKELVPPGPLAVSLKYRQIVPGL